MEEYHIQETPEPEEEKKIVKDKTFNRLKNIQSLLKKEVALNELCKFKEII